MKGKRAIAVRRPTAPKLRHPVGAPTDPPTRHAWLLPLVAIVLTSAVVRVIVWCELADEPFFRTPPTGNDFDLHWQQAAQILRGIPHPSFELQAASAPLPGYWKACLRAVVGDSPLHARLLSGFLGALSPALLFIVALRANGNRWSAFAVALGFGLLPSVVASDLLAAKTAVELPLLLGILWSAFAIPSATPRKQLILAGFMGLGLGVLRLSQGSSVALAFPIVAASAVAARQAGSTSARLARMLGACAVLFVATYAGSMALRGKPEHHRYAPLAGVHFNLGWHRGADGIYDRLPGIGPNPIGHTFDARLMAEVTRQRPLTALETDAFYRSQALTFIASNPTEAARLLVRKIRLFFNDAEAKSDDDLGFLAERSRLFGSLPFGLGIFYVLAALGVVRLAASRASAPLIALLGTTSCVLVTNLLGFITWRYRLPVAVPVCLLAAFGLEQITSMLRSRTPSSPRPLPSTRRAWWKGVATMGVVVATSALAWTDVLTAEDRASMTERAQSAAERSLSAEATIAGLGGDPPAQQFVSLGTLRRHSDAYRIALRRPEVTLAGPTQAGQWLTYLLWTGNHAEARRFFGVLRAERSSWASAVPARMGMPARRALALFVPTSQASYRGEEFADYTSTSP